MNRYNWHAGELTKVSTVVKQTTADSERAVLQKYNENHDEKGRFTFANGESIKVTESQKQILEHLKGGGHITSRSLPNAKRMHTPSDNADFKPSSKDIDTLSLAGHIVGKQNYEKWGRGTRWFLKGNEPDLEKIEAQHTDGAMVCISIPPSVGQQLHAIAESVGFPPETLMETPQNMHVTLAYLPNTQEVLTRRSEITNALIELADDSPPLVGRIQGYGVFNGKEGMNVLFALLDEPELPTLRQRVCDTLQDLYVSYSDEYGFVPHITLATFPSTFEIPAGFSIPDIEGVRLNFVCLCVGTDWAPIELTGLKKFNENHDPSTGEFASSGAAGVVVPRGTSAIQDNYEAHYDTTKSEHIEKQLDHALMSVDESEYSKIDFKRAKEVYTGAHGQEAWKKYESDLKTKPFRALTYATESIYGGKQREFLNAVYEDALAHSQLAKGYDPGEPRDENGQWTRLGGSYRRAKMGAAQVNAASTEVDKKGRKVILEEVHHMPAAQATTMNGLSFENSPAIRMSKADHELTASYGNKAGAIAYRQRQKDLLREGKFAEAQQMDIDDLHEKFGNKYDPAIEEMKAYTKSLKTNKRTGNPSNPSRKVIMAGKA